MNNTEQSLNAKMLERVRALLAKAESTTFPAEADAFRAKADEIMTRHAIDQWMVEQAQGAVGARPEPVRRDFECSWRKSPFRYDLNAMFTDLARHCRCIVGYRGSTWETMPVYGLPSDLDYLDLLYTQLALEVAKRLQPAVDPAGEVGHEVFKQRQSGTAWPDITRKCFAAGLVKMTEKQLATYNERRSYWQDEIDAETPYVNLPVKVKTDLKNRLANANRRYVRDNGLEMERNYVRPEVYQRSFMYGFVAEIQERLAAMSAASRTAYDADHEAGSMGLAIRDIREQALSVYNAEFPPPPPVAVDPNYKPPKGRRLAKLREVTIDHSAISAGRAAGREANLNKPGKPLRQTPEIDR